MSHLLRLIPLILWATTHWSICASTPSAAFRCPFVALHNGTLVFDEPEQGQWTEEELEEMEDIIWCLPKTYLMERPPFGGKTQKTLKLSFNFDIREISEINDRGQSLSLPMYFSVAWQDKRIWINESSPAWNENMTGPLNEVTEDPKVLMSEFWVPDLEIYGLELFGSKSVLKEMSGLRIRKDKTIEFNTRVTVTVSCRMIFDDYPFDKHTCAFQVGSYYYLKDIVTCSSRYNDPIINEPERQRNLQHYVSFSNLTDSQKTIELVSGSYAACGFQVHLYRKRYQLIFQIYLPCVLFVGVSWVSFLIRPDVVPGRMALLVTLFLVLVNIFNTVRSSAPIPASSTLNAIDTYLVVSILMVFLALLEYAVVLFTINMQDNLDITERKQCLKEALSQKQSAEASPNTETTHLKDVNEVIREINAKMASNYPRKALLQRDFYKLGRFSIRKVDLVGLVVLPCLFAVFNLWYWVNYTFFV